MTRLLVLLALLQGCGSCSGETATTGTSGHDAAPRASEAAAPAHKVEAGPDTSFDALPDAGVADLQIRGKHLLQAIAENDASLAADILIPRAAFVAARDVRGDPGAVYESKLQLSFANQIARIRRHEKGMDGAVFVSFDLGGSPARVEPRRHEWKIPVWTIRHSKLTFTIDGRVKRIEIGEMIAWRGAWYVSRIREGR